MDRISSCAMSSYSKTRTVLSIPSRVANLSAIARSTRARWKLFLWGDWNLKRHRDEGKRNFYLFFIKITIAPSRLSKLQLQLLQWLTNKEKQACVLPSLFYPGFVVVWRRGWSSGLWFQIAQQRCR